MFSKIWTRKSTPDCSQPEQLKKALHEADAVIIGAGAGLSTSAGFTYAGERFRTYFSDFASKYGFTDMYSGGFYPYSTMEEYWAYWSRYIYINRYQNAPKPVYGTLFRLVQDKDHFVITTNVDHCFQKAGKPDSLRKTLGSKKFLFCLGRRCKASFRIHHTFTAGMPSATWHFHSV